MVRSDHAALSYLKRAKEPVGQQARWLDFIEQFQLDLQYRKGASHANADALSRRPCERQGQTCRQCTDRSQAAGPKPPGSVEQKEERQATSGAKADGLGTTGGAGRAQTGSVTTRAQARKKMGQTGREAAAVPGPVAVGNGSVVEQPQPAHGQAAASPESGGMEKPPEPNFNDPENNQNPTDQSENLQNVETANFGGTDVGNFPIGWTHQHLAELQKADVAIGVVYGWLERQVPPSKDELLPHSPEVKNYASQWTSLCIIDGVVYRKFERPTGGVQWYQLMLPRTLRNELLEMMHAGAACHLAVKKTSEQVQRRAYWHTWRSDTERFCRRCGPCNQYCKGKAPRQGQLQDMRVGYPFERLQIDLTGPHPTANGFSYVCTVICSFTKFVIAWPIRDKKAITVARGLVDRVILPFGTPRLLLSDNGREFENELMQELCRLLGVEKQRSTFYTPQCNGAIERWHSAMNSLLAKTVETHQRDWPQRLPFVVAAYNSSVHESTGYSPNRLMFGRETAMAADVALGNPSPQRLSPNDYADHVVDS